MNKYAPLRAIFFISLLEVLPLLIMWLIGTKDFQGQKIFNYWVIIFVPFAIFIVSLTLGAILIYFRIINLKSMTYIVPIGLMFLAMIFTSFTSLNISLRVIISLVVAILSTIISHFIITALNTWIKNSKTQAN
ncbi:hypothetical protein KQ874_03330 [Mycoplasma sp. ES3157-GEN-MYC]|uniref:Uncharacterized protein n=1 Tax=Mycoplasma miroungigenitalium TaxID=754515 RepID=A0A6M4JCN9_9MOLU|nr:hypothetical protein [Mycoplasma miroungigenitalium]MBU4690709.1 hypothetical protein [Mycoplasma miroungigenitalium]MBU4691978.1 hypothetical protein [Mycoplasma miroungigenitalium]QJR43829.1 hypothetical protein HLA87_03525 [Mycoplasma miroungigenitalium]